MGTMSMKTRDIIPARPTTTARGDYANGYRAAVNDMRGYRADGVSDEKLVAMATSIISVHAAWGRTDYEYGQSDAWADLQGNARVNRRVNRRNW